MRLQPQNGLPAPSCRATRVFAKKPPPTGLGEKIAAK